MDFKPGKSDYKLVEKAWGYERWLANDEVYCGKELFIAKGRSCSWHLHFKKRETFYIIEGELLVLYGWDDNRDKAESVILEAGDVFNVPIGLRHQMRAIRDTKFIEISTQHFDSDSHRIIPGD
jgi:mannose-6-phosphate isomerase-like protein (cupin superfamily)